MNDFIVLESKLNRSVAVRSSADQAVARLAEVIRRKHLSLNMASWRRIRD
jgi:hypothetical protein